jgi:putative oxidoreductase
MDIGVLLIRVVFGLVMAAHGAQKLFGWFGGYGLTGTGGFFENLGFRPGRVFAALASSAETAGGLLIALGLLGPVGPALMISVMIVAAGAVHWSHGLFAANNGIEVPLLYSTAGVGLTLIGFGVYSFDAVLGLTPFWTPQVSLSLLAVGAIGGLANLALRRPPAHSTAAA